MVTYTDPDTRQKMPQPTTVENVDSRTGFCFPAIARKKVTAAFDVSIRRGPPCGAKAVPLLRALV